MFFFFLGDLGNQGFPKRTSVDGAQVSYRCLRHLGINNLPEISRSSRLAKLITSARPALLTLALSPLYILIHPSMADALKAEGNQAFSAKDYPTAMYVATPPSSPEVRTDADESSVRNSLKLSALIPRTTFFTPTAPPFTPPRMSIRKRSRMRRSPSASSPIGPRASSARELPTVVWEICVSGRVNTRESQ